MIGTNISQKHVVLVFHDSLDMFSVDGLRSQSHGYRKTVIRSRVMPTCLFKYAVHNSRTSIHVPFSDGYGLKATGHELQIENLLFNSLGNKTSTAPYQRTKHGTG